MISTIFFLFGLVVFGKITPGSAQSCSIPTPVAIDGKSFLEAAKRGFFVPLQSKLSELTSLMEMAELDKATYKTKLCYTVTLSSGTKTHKLTLACQLADPTVPQAFCNLETKGTPFHKNFRYHGEFYTGKTDGSTYYVQVGCLFGTTPTFYVLSTGKALTPPVKKEIVDYLVSIGIEKTEISSGSDYVVFQKQIFKDCAQQNRNDMGMGAMASSMTSMFG